MPGNEQRNFADKLTPPPFQEPGVALISASPTKEAVLDGEAQFSNSIHATTDDDGQIRMLGVIVVGWNLVGSKMEEKPPIPQPLLGDQESLSGLVRGGIISDDGAG